MTRAALALTLALSLAGAGCASRDPAPDPAAVAARGLTDGGAPERARAGLAGGTQSGSVDEGSSREAGERSRRTHHTDDDFQAAAEELAGKLRERGDRGWPAHVELAGEPPRPVVRLTSKNRSRELIDMRAFEDRVAATLSAAGVADMAAGGGAEGALVLDASISDEVTDTPEMRRVDYTIQFVLTEPRQGGVLVTSVTRLARVRSKS